VFRNTLAGKLGNDNIFCGETFVSPSPFFVKYEVNLVKNIHRRILVMTISSIPYE